MYVGHLEAIYAQVKYMHDIHEEGPLLEFGVSQGTSIAIMAEAMKEFGMTNRIIGFDSFQGLPEDEGNWKKGEFDCSLEHVRENLAPWPNIELIPGWYDQVLTNALKNTIEPPGLIHIDCDIYSSTYTVLSWLRNLIKTGTTFIFDEWPVSEYKAWEQTMNGVEVEVVADAQQRIHRVTKA